MPSGKRGAGGRGKKIFFGYFPHRRGKGGRFQIGKVFKRVFSPALEFFAGGGVSPDRFAPFL